ncbi:MAG: sigma-54 dependent transcriptional regulator, partial [Sedimenticola sp.]|nr:sigma-54 dependent transcriptional regulator [Sedimenticola sp.]
GNSNKMREVFQMVSQVSKSNATVLIRGESGTGKELVANSIHYGSLREKGPFVKVNCAALPATLIESELFGHEKGAFTGAVKQKMGKFELAHGGTLFLDEISEISPDIQLKLLRFLQEREFERVGGNETIKSDVRIITATNKDLATMVSSGTFRQDLYYRLKVVTIELPTLRERQEDIPLLVQYFMEKIRQEMGRSVDMIPEETMAQLKSYPWPGNVRELENALRRAVLLSPNDVLLPETLQLESNTPQARLPLFIKSIQELEKEHIENILQFTGFEKKRAAQILDISRPTLNTRIRSYGIEMPDK